MSCAKLDTERRIADFESWNEGGYQLNPDPRKVIVVRWCKEVLRWRIPKIDKALWRIAQCKSAVTTRR